MLVLTLALTLARSLSPGGLLVWLRDGFQTCSPPSHVVQVTLPLYIYNVSIYKYIYGVVSSEEQGREDTRSSALPPGVGCSSKLSSSLQLGFTLLVENGRGLQREPSEWGGEGTSSSRLPPRNTASVVLRTERRAGVPPCGVAVLPSR